MLGIRVSREAWSLWLPWSTSVVDMALARIQTYMLADTVVAIPAVDVAVEAAV